MHFFLNFGQGDPLSFTFITYFTHNSLAREEHAHFHFWSQWQMKAAKIIVSLVVAAESNLHLSILRTTPFIVKFSKKITFDIDDNDNFKELLVVVLCVPF